MTQANQIAELKKELRDLKNEVDELDSDLPFNGSGSSNDAFNDEVRTKIIRTLDSMMAAIPLGASHPTRVEAEKRLNDLKAELGVWG